MRRAVLLCFACLYLALAVRLASTFTAFSEEVMVQPAPSSQMLSWRPAGDGSPLQVLGCRQDGTTHALWLDDRPRWALCAGGRIWPVMTARYLGGFLFWPLGAASAALGDALIPRRALSAALGLLALFVASRLAREAEGDAAGDLTAVALATCPTFIVTHTLFLHYETAPTTLVLLALAALAPALRRAPVSAARLAAAGLLCGLALAVNLRAVVLLGVLAVVAWRLRAPLPRSTWGARAGAAAGLLAGLSPALLRVALDPGAARGDRFDLLGAALSQNLRHPGVLLEAGLDALLWWSNLAHYFSNFNGPAGFNAPALVICVAAGGFVLAEGLRALWRREGSALAASLALALLGFWVVGALIYTSYPRNMAPLGAVFGMCLGLALARLSGWLARRGASARARLGLCAALTLPCAYNVEQLAAASLRSPAPYNLVSERATAAYLQAHPLPGSLLVSTDLFVAGVFEALGRGGATVVHAEPLFESCPRGDRGCRVERMRALLRWSGDRPTRFLLLAPDLSLSPEDRAPTFDEVRGQLAQAGARMETEFHAPTPAGTEGILVLRVYGPGAASSAATGAASASATR